MKMRMMGSADFVWRAACPYPTSADIDAMRDVAAGIDDWTPVLAAAERLRAGPMLWRALLAGAAPEAPPVIEERLQHVALTNAARNLVLRERLFKLVAAFERAGVRALAYKGIVLAMQAYEGLEDRQMEDLDFLVHPDDILAAIAVVGELGYRPMLDLRPPELRAQLRRGWGYAARSADRDIAIELDTGIGPDFFSMPLDLPALLCGAVAVEESGRRVHTLGEAALLVLLCAHGAKHMWARPQWVGDLVGLIRRSPALDWNAVQELAASTRTRRILHTGLALAGACAAIVLPDAVALAVAADGHAQELAQHALARAAVAPDTNRSASETLRFHLASRECPRDRMRYVLASLFKPSHGDWKWLPLPGPLFALYYVLRPLRLAFKGLRGMVVKTAAPAALIRSWLVCS